MEARLGALEKEVKWLRRLGVTQGKLLHSVDRMVTEEVAQHRVILFVHRDKRREVLEDWNEFQASKPKFQPNRKPRRGAKASEEEEAEGTDAMDEKWEEDPPVKEDPRDRPHWGTQLYLTLLQDLREVVSERKKPESGKSKLAVQGLESLISDTYEKDPRRVVKYAFPHTPTPDLESWGTPWPWTLHLLDGDTGGTLRERLLFDFQPLMKASSFLVKGDVPKQGGGALRQELGEILQLNKGRPPVKREDKKGKDGKRSAAPATPLRGGNRARQRTERR
jgi:hypothetical protein